MENGKKTVICLTLRDFPNIIEIMFFRRGGVLRYENDLSAKEKVQSESSRIQSQNENGWRKKSVSSKKIKRKKKIVSVGRIYVAFFLNLHTVFVHKGIL